MPSLTAERGAEVARRQREGDSESALARVYGVSRATVCNTRQRAAQETA